MEREVRKHVALLPWEDRQKPSFASQPQEMLTVLCVTTVFCLCVPSEILLR